MVQVEILINAIQERPILWDKRSKNYYNRLLSYREWEKLAKEVGTTSDKVKKKWKNLRDTFLKELKKIPKPRSGTDGDNEPKYTGTWPYFDIMYFLSVIVKPRKTKEILEDLTDTSKRNSMDVSEITVANSLEVVLNENVGNKTDLQESLSILQEPLQNTSTQLQDSDSAVQDISLCKMPSPSRSMPAVRRQTRKRKDDNESEAFLEIERENLKEKLKVLRQDQQDVDDDLLWFRSILPFMKQLPPINNLHFRTKMQEILLTELSKINKPQTSS